MTLTMMQIAILAMVFVLVMALVFGVASLLRPDAARQRLEVVAGGGEMRGPWRERLVQGLAEFTRPVSQLAVPEEGFEQSSVKLRFLNAGIRNPSAPTAFFGLKALLTIGLPLIAFVVLTLTKADVRGNGLLAVLLFFAAAGYYGPNIVLARMVEYRQREIFENFPDALDLMTICVEAGLGTEAAMMRVAEDMQFKCPALSEEMRIVNLELRAGADRQRTLRNLALRTGVEEIDGFVTMLSQAERFGTSIAASLRIQSDMLRTRRRQKAEEAAAKIALKLLFPLIFCIFPALLVVLMGPAVIQVMRVLMPTMSGGSV